jgi:ABC-2 type transport system permease protein
MLMGVVALGLIQGVVFLVVGLLFGVNVRAGVGGMLLIVLFMMLIALGFGSLGAILALRSGSVEAVESSFPLFFVAIFLSSINLPRALIQADWFRAVATVNPVSYLVEGLRSLIITGWDPRALALGFGCALGLIVLSLAGAAASLRTRMASS